MELHSNEHTVWGVPFWLLGGGGGGGGGGGWGEVKNLIQLELFFPKADFFQSKSRTCYRAYRTWYFPLLKGAAEFFFKIFCSPPPPPILTPRKTKTNGWPLNSERITTVRSRTLSFHPHLSFLPTISASMPSEYKIKRNKAVTSVSNHCSECFIQTLKKTNDTVCNAIRV